MPIRHAIRRHVILRVAVGIATQGALYVLLAANSREAVPRFEAAALKAPQTPSKEGNVSRRALRRRPL